MWSGIRIGFAVLVVSALGATAACEGENFSPNDAESDTSGGQGGGAIGQAEAGSGGDSDGVVGAACAPGARACDGKLPLSCGDDRTWLANSECQFACLLGECVECSPGASRCDDGSAQRCDDDGTWIATPCGGECLDGECVEECTDEDALRCRDGNTPELCQDGLWIAQDDCSGDAPACDEGTGVCRCASGARRCLDANTPEKCNAAGVWEPETDCSGDAPSCEAGVCQCVEGAKECVDSQAARHCVNGAWAEVTCGGELAACDDAGGECARPQSLADRIHCDEEANLVCDGPDVCCVRQNTDVRECTAAGDCAQGAGTTFKYVCDDKTDCPGGQFCCWIGDPGGSRTECVAEGGCTSPYSAKLACDPDADDCPEGETCQPSTLEFPSLYVCE